MNKYKISTLIFFVLIFSIIPFVSAEVRVDMPNVLTESRTYKASIIIDEPSLQKYTKSIKYYCNNCGVFLDPEDRAEGDNNLIDLRGRDRIDFYIGGDLDRREREATGTVSSLKLIFYIDYDALKKDYPNHGVYTGIAAEFTKYFGVIKSERTYELPSLPSDTDSDWIFDELYGKYTFTDEQDSSFDKKPMLTLYEFYMQDYETLTPYDDFGGRCGMLIDTKNIEKGENGEGHKINEISLLGGSGYSYAFDHVGSVYPVKDDDGKVLYNLGIVRVGVVVNVFNEAEKECYEGKCRKEAYVKEGEQDSFANSAIEECKQILGSYKRKPIGSAPSIPEDEFEYFLPGREKKKLEYKELCKGDSDCDEGERCTACGECKKENKVYDSEDAEVEFSLTKKFSSKAIPNTIHNRILIKTKINPKITVDGKKIDYCSLSYPGLEGYEYIAEMKNEDSYAGFIFG